MGHRTYVKKWQYQQKSHQSLIVLKVASTMDKVARAAEPPTPTNVISVVTITATASARAARPQGKNVREGNG